MLSFCTEFPVEETSATEFCRAVGAWLDGSPHTKLTANDVLNLAVPNSTPWKDSTTELNCALIDGVTPRTAGFRYSAVDGGVEWITTVCFDSDEVDSWVSVRTERHSQEAQPYIPDAKKPFVIRNLLAGLKGGMDGELRVSEAPHVLDSNDAAMAVRLLNGDSEHRLPLVYLSRPFSGELQINVDALARHLAGVAHVLVEPSRDFSKEIEEQVFSSNPYGGFIGIYFSGSAVQKIAPRHFDNEFDVRRLIFENIRNSLVNRRPLTRCSWANLEAEIAKRERQTIARTGSDEVREYAENFDKELSAKDQLLSDAEKEIRRLKSQILDFSKTSKGTGAFSLSFGKEQQLTDDEFVEVILDAIGIQVANVVNSGRRQHILQAVLDSNQASGRLKSKREDIKNLLRDYTNMSSTIRSGLEDMGFSVSEEGKHIKIIYKGDSRYTFILPKSGSDHRGGKNAASDIAKHIF